MELLRLFFVFGKISFDGIAGGRKTKKLLYFIVEMYEISTSPPPNGGAYPQREDFNCEL